VTSEIERVRRAAKELHLAVRGYYGEGSESAGDFYQISNQVTLGRSEADLLAEFNENIIPRIIDYELQARRLLRERDPVVLEDRTNRALGVLRAARLLGAEEAMKLLSRVRLGMYVGSLTGLDAARINRLFLEIQPAHLQQRFGGTLTPDQLRERRAAIVRQSIS
jgi:protein arginine kinase